MQPGGEASTTQLDNNRKTFAKTGTNENTVMATAGFVPNQVAAFVAVADAQDPINNTFDNKTINGVYRPSWYSMYIATPAWKQFMNTYLAAINAPIDNDYGKGADKYTVSKGRHQNIQPVPIPAPAEQSAAKPAADQPRPAAAIAATAC